LCCVLCFVFCVLCFVLYSLIAQLCCVVLCFVFCVLCFVFCVLCFFFFFFFRSLCIVGSSIALIFCLCTKFERLIWLVTKRLQKLHTHINKKQKPPQTGKLLTKKIYKIWIIQSRKGEREIDGARVFLLSFLAYSIYMIKQKLWQETLPWPQ